LPQKFYVPRHNIFFAAREYISCSKKMKILAARKKLFCHYQEKKNLASEIISVGGNVNMRDILYLYESFIGNLYLYEREITRDNFILDIRYHFCGILGLYGDMSQLLSLKSG